MSAPRRRGALFFVVAASLALASACTNGTEPAQALCDPSNPVTLNVGEVSTPISGSCVFISTSTAGEYALVPFNADTNYGKTASIMFFSQNASAATAALQQAPITSGVSFNIVPGATAPAVTISHQYELRLRATEQRALRSMFPAARYAYRRPTTGTLKSGLSPSFSTTAATWNVGDIVHLNANSDDPCANADIRTGRVVAISTHAIVVADTNNPAGGYTDTEYQSIATQFDAVYTMDTNAFGQPSDIDNNGKIIMFFTRAVNELTPANATSVVGGFFFARDLFPTTATGGLQACATSNYSEMFYLVVADPNGLVNGYRGFTKDFVTHLTVSTTAHEFQHLINAARRLYVNTAAQDFEIPWLNEGLSHIAEELLFYQQSAGLSPRMDIDSTKFKGNQTNVNAYNFDQAGNFGRFRSYIARPSTSSPYAPDDSLWTRGATWSFLRYAADHRGSSDGDTWMRLVNSTTTGMQNLQDVFGSNLPDLFRDWAVANIADDVPNTPNEWQHPSWNFKSVYHYISDQVLRNGGNPPYRGYPLATLSLSDASPVTVSLNGGGAAYVRFTLAASQIGSVKWDTQSSTVVMSLVRLK